MFIQVYFLTGKTIVIKPKERLTEVDRFSLFQTPGDWLELFEPRPQILLSGKVEILYSMCRIATHAVSG